MAFYVLLESGDRLILENGSGFLLREEQETPGGGGSKSSKKYDDDYEPYHVQEFKYRQQQLEKEAQAAKRELEKADKRVKKVEASRELALADLVLQKKLLDAMREMEAARIAYENLQFELAMLNDDEEAIIALLLSTVF